MRFLLLWFRDNDFGTQKEQSIRKTAMAAYVANNDKSVLPKSYDDVKISKTQRMTHEEILGSMI